ncbi:hypothetical protein V8B97DRAFT_2008786 [Scleroderma yunnanense]
MPTAKYQRLPSSPRDDDDDDTPRPSTRTTSRNSSPPNRHIDPRFDRPPPAAWKRIALILFIIFLFWLSYAMRPKKDVQPEVIYASRYSKEFKYRPAASPIITERLKDGRVRLRGAYPST